MSPHAVRRRSNIGDRLSTPFLTAYAHRVVHRLVGAAAIEIEPESIDEVVAFVADYLASRPQGFSAISSTSKALIMCPNVVELFADDDEIKEIVDGLQTTRALSR